MKNLSLKTLLLLSFTSICTLTLSCQQTHKQVENSQQTGNEVKNETQSQPVIKNEFKRGEVYASVPCRNDASQSYALFIPQADEKIKLPLIIFFDPHGGGNFVISKYKNLASEFGFVLAVSNNSKNGLLLPQSLSIGNNLLDDVMSRVAIDSSRVYAAGFSGGAKVAIISAMQNKMINGAIYSGAAISLDGSIHSFSLLGIAGNRDMNYSDLLLFDKGIKNDFPHCLIEWNGKHEWPDSATYRKAFYWLSFDGMKRKVIPVNEQLISKYRQESASGNSNNSLLAQYEQVKESISFLDGISNTNSLKKSLEGLSNNATVEKLLVQRNKTADEEQTLHDQYRKALLYNDLAWWQKEIARMNNDKSDVEGPMNQRLLGYVSLNCYYACQDLVQQNDEVTTQKMLTIYKLADPDNADQRYFNAIFLARHNKNKEAIAQLKEAATLGFDDKNKAMSEKAFASLVNDNDFQQAIDMMGGK